MKTTGLRGKVVLITGAISGIGAAIAREAAARGAISLLVGRNAEKLAEVELDSMQRWALKDIRLQSYKRQGNRTPCIARSR